MTIYTEKHYRDYGDDQACRLKEGFTLDSLVHFEHEGVTIINPYCHTTGDPVDLFGKEKMDAWKAECRELWLEFAADQ